MHLRPLARLSSLVLVVASVLAASVPSGSAVVAGVDTRTATIGKTVALTFDDGPGPDTAAILAVLAKYGVRATFFNVGTAMAARPDLVRAIADHGHTLGDHTWNHPHLSQLTEAEQAAELDQQAAEQRALVGTTPMVMRPPYGEYDATTLALAAARGMSVWNWSCSTQDWMADGASTSYWVDRIVTRAEAAVKGPHPVILMHDAPGAGDPATALALPRIIRFFRDHGYTFVDVLGRSGLAPYAPTGAPAPAVATTDGGLHVFTRDPDGHVVEQTHSGGVWGKPRLLGGSSVAGPAAATAGRRTTLLAVVDQTGSVQVRDVGDSSASGWTSIGGRSVGGGAVGRPAVAADAARGTAYVAVRTATGTIAYRARAHGRWQAWRSLGGKFVTAPSMTVPATRTPVVVAVTAGGTVMLTRRTGPGWSGWRRVGVGSSADPALGTTPDGRQLALVLRDVRGTIQLRTGNARGTSWSAPRPIAGVAASGAAVAVSGRRLNVLVVNGVGTVRVSRAASSAPSAAMGAAYSVPAI